MNNEQIRLEEVKKLLNQLPPMDNVENVKKALDTFEWIVKELRTIYFVMGVRERLSNEEIEEGDTYRKKNNKRILLS
jgi:hypothetical protein